MSQNTMFQLDTEDLAYLLHLSGITTFPGFPPEIYAHPFTEVAKNMLETVMTVRGMLQRGEDGQIQLDALISTFLHIVGEARFLADILSIHPGKRWIGVVLAFSEHGALECLKVNAQLYQFMVMYDSEGARRRMEYLMPIVDVPPLLGQPLHVSENGIWEFIAQTNGTATPFASEIPAAQEQAMVTSLKECMTNQQINLWYDLDVAHNQPESLDVVQGPGGGYLIRQDSGSTSGEIIPVSASAARQAIDQLFAPALAILPQAHT